MKIREIHVFSVPLPVKEGPYRVASGEVWALDSTIVKVVCHDGLVGWGKTCPDVPFAVEQPCKAIEAVAAVAPGWIETDLNADFVAGQPDPVAFRAGLGRIHPIGRTGGSEGVAAMVAWLASGDASLVTGQVFIVNGGRTAKLSLP